MRYHKQNCADLNWVTLVCLTHLQMRWYYLCVLQVIIVVCWKDCSSREPVTVVQEGEHTLFTHLENCYFCAWQLCVSQTLLLIVYLG
jgi:hypothetical protein